MPGSSRGSFYARVIATNRWMHATFVARYAGPFGHGRAASLALKCPPFVTRIFRFDPREPHWRAAPRAQRMDDLVFKRRLIRLMRM